MRIFTGNDDPKTLTKMIPWLQRSAEYAAEKYYSKEQIDEYLRDIVNGRRKFTEKVAEEGLDREIINAAEDSYSIAPEKSTSVYFSSAKKIPTEEKPPARLTDWKPNSRLIRDRGWRYG